ncbi:hypothetical protein IAQ61_003120 [Plenodomus lingam]|uniref:uncharacterized protein n=1 Tax=Leptosphaeria maculans TaxID=5022 RepID=UPI0033313FAC|nr:hypothetical protein IAQ61_003120 [Plenodomus lingam]
MAMSVGWQKQSIMANLQTTRVTLQGLTNRFGPSFSPRATGKSWLRTGSETCMDYLAHDIRLVLVPNLRCLPYFLYLAPYVPTQEQGRESLYTAPIIDFAFPGVPIGSYSRPHWKRRSILHSLPEQWRTGCASSSLA